MKLSELKAIIDRIYDEHGDLDCVYPFSIPTYQDPAEPCEMTSDCIYLGWMDKDGKRLTSKPINPITDRTVLVIE